MISTNNLFHLQQRNNYSRIDYLLIFIYDYVLVIIFILTLLLITYKI